MSSKKKRGFRTSMKGFLERHSPFLSRGQSPSPDPPPSPSPSAALARLPVSPAPASGTTSGDTGDEPGATLVVPPLVSSGAEGVFPFASDVGGRVATAPITPSSPSVELKTTPANGQRVSMEGAQHGPPPSALEKAMDHLGVIESLAIMLIKRVPDVIDGNPVTMAFGLAKTIIEISEAVEGNKSAVEQQVIWTCAQLLIVQNSLAEWTAKDSSETEAMKSFEGELKKHYQSLVDLKKHCLLRKIATHEKLEGEIADIFAQVNQAREELLLKTQLKLHRLMQTIQESLAKSLLRDLKPSDAADFKYYAEGQEREALRRNVCAPETRVSILDAIKAWAKDNSEGSESVYWLSGSTGTGKSTIAYTVATHTTTTSPTMLGGNFFCSRQFDRTRHSKRIIPTIVCQLAYQCPAFATALDKRDLNLAALAQQSPSNQLEELLAKPWIDSAKSRSLDPYIPPTYLIIIDALDEIEADGGTNFLYNLLDMINARRLPGLKFFITGRPNPSIVTHVETFANKKLFRLEDIPFDEAAADIEKYLNSALPGLKDPDLLRKLVRLAAGLFIFAATVVTYLIEGYPTAKEKRRALNELIKAMSTQGTIATPPNATEALDKLYVQILTEAFKNLADGPFASRLQIVHTFLCTAERTSTAVVARLLAEDDADDSEDSELDDNPASDVVRRLYSVLYTEHGKVFAYHKSFSDFIFDKTRSGRFSCDQSTHHRFLATCSLRLLTSPFLHFNIASIPSSYVLDQDNPVLQDEAQLEENIPSHVRYACRYWAHHLKQTGPHDDKNAPLLISLAEFIKLRALFWIEAMSVLGCAELCDPILWTAYDFVPPDNPTLQQALSEAASFALYFSGSPASLSTPHLYISALSTTLQTAYPISEWKSHFPAIPRFTSSQVRTSALMTIPVGSEVFAVAISDDGTLIVGGAWNGLVQVWDGLTGKLLHDLKGHTRRVTSILFFRDNSRVVSTSYDGKARIWEVQKARARELQVLEASGGPIFCAAISPNGTQLVCGMGDGSAPIWDVETGEILRIMSVKGRYGSVGSVAVADPSGQWVCAALSTIISVWETDGIFPSRDLKGHHDEITFLGFSPGNHSLISASNDDTIRVWDPTTGEQLVVLENDATRGLSALAMSRDGSKVVVGAKHGEVRILDSRTWSVIGSMKGHGSRVNAIVFSADEKRILSASGDGSIRVCNTLSACTPESQGASTQRSTTADKSLDDHGIYRVAVSHDGTKVLSASEDNDTIRLWDAATGNLLRHFNSHTSNKFHSLAFSTDNHTMFSISKDGVLRRWDLSTGEASHILTIGFTINRVSISRDGAQLIASVWEDNVVHIWDTSTGAVVHALKETSCFATAISLSDSCNKKYAGIADTTVRVWDIGSSQQAHIIWTSSDHGGEIAAIAFSPDCSQIASASEDNTCHIWDIVAGTCVWTLNGHTNWVDSMSFSPDGAILASGSWDGTLRLWDTSTGLVREVLEGHTAEVEDVVFSPDGRKVISGSIDGTIRVWSVSSESDNLAPRPYRVQKKLDESTEELQRTGWLLGHDDNDLLICVPVEDMVPDSFDTIVIPPSRSSSVSFEGAALGPNWTSCYSKPT